MVARDARVWDMVHRHTNCVRGVGGVLFFFIQLGSRIIRSDGKRHGQDGDNHLTERG